MKPEHMRYARHRPNRTYGLTTPAPIKRNVPQMEPGTQNNAPTKRTPQQLAARAEARKARMAARKAARTAR